MLLYEATVLETARPLQACDSDIRRHRFFAFRRDNLPIRDQDSAAAADSSVMNSADLLQYANAKYQNYRNHCSGTTRWM